MQENKRISIPLPLPDLGTSYSVEAHPNSLYVLQFDPATASLSRDGNDLLFDLPDERHVTVTSYFTQPSQELGPFLVPGNIEVAGVDLLEGSSMDLTLGP